MAAKSDWERYRSRLFDTSWSGLARTNGPPAGFREAGRGLRSRAQPKHEPEGALHLRPGPIDHSDGATWLDREPTSRNPSPLGGGFGRDVSRALDRREKELVREGMGRHGPEGQFIYPKAPLPAAGSGGKPGRPGDGRRAWLEMGAGQGGRVRNRHPDRKIRSPAAAWGWTRALGGDEGSTCRRTLIVPSPRPKVSPHFVHFCLNVPAGISTPRA